MPRIWRKITILIPSLICIFFIVALFACSQKKFISKESTSIESISLVHDESYFMDFEIEDNLVYIECSLTVQNNNDSDYIFQISADFSKDVEIGLLTDDVLYACDAQNQRQNFILKVKEKKVIECFFIGEYGGTHRKSDRNLPSNITFHERLVEWSISKYSEITARHYEETAAGYKAAIYRKEEINIDKVINQLEAYVANGKYYHYIYSDPDSWDMYIYYPFINGASIEYNGFKFFIDEGVVNVFVDSNGDLNIEQHNDYLLIRVQAPSRGIWPNSSELFIDNIRIDR